MASSPKAPADPIDARLVRKLADILTETGLSEIEVEHGGLKVRVAKQVGNAAVHVAAPPPAAYAAPVAAAPVGAAAAEGALHLEDILARRMRISIEYPHRGVDCASEVAELVAPVLGWSDSDVNREVANYTARVEAEILSQAQPDDVSADELRASAPEARAEILEPVPLT